MTALRQSFVLRQGALLPSSPSSSRSGSAAPTLEHQTVSVSRTSVSFALNHSPATTPNPGKKRRLDPEDEEYVPNDEEDEDLDAPVTARKRPRQRDALNEKCKGQSLPKEASDPDSGDDSDKENRPPNRPVFCPPGLQLLEPLARERKPTKTKPKKKSTKTVLTLTRKEDKDRGGERTVINGSKPKLDRGFLLEQTRRKRVEYSEELLRHVKYLLYVPGEDCPPHLRAVRDRQEIEPWLENFRSVLEQCNERDLTRLAILNEFAGCATHVRFQHRNHIIVRKKLHAQLGDSKQMPDTAVKATLIKRCVHRDVQFDFSPYIACIDQGVLDEIAMRQPIKAKKKHLVAVGAPPLRKKPEARGNGALLRLLAPMTNAIPPAPFLALDAPSPPSALWSPPAPLSPEPPSPVPPVLSLPSLASLPSLPSTHSTHDPFEKPMEGAVAEEKDTRSSGVGARRSLSEYRSLLTDYMRILTVQELDKFWATMPQYYADMRLHKLQRIQKTQRHPPLSETGSLSETSPRTPTTLTKKEYETLLVEFMQLLTLAQLDRFWATMPKFYAEMRHHKVEKEAHRLAKQKWLQQQQKLQTVSAIRSPPVFCPSPSVLRCASDTSPWAAAPPSSSSCSAFERPSFYLPPLPALSDSGYRAIVATLPALPALPKP